MTTMHDLEALAAYKCPNMPIQVGYIKLAAEAREPSKAHVSDAGFDLYSIHDIELSHDAQTVLVRTGIAMAIPIGYYGRIASRSGLSINNNIEIGAGVIDSGYRGEIMVKLRLFHSGPGDAPVVLRKGSRVAQLIITPCPPASMRLVDQLDNTERADGAFGSSGK
jgi:dUTP pyrophosphatase